MSYKESFQGRKGNFGFSSELIEEFDDVEQAFDAVDVNVTRALRATLPVNELPIASSRINKMLVTDAFGNLNVIPKGDLANKIALGTWARTGTPTIFDTASFDIIWTDEKVPNIQYYEMSGADQDVSLVTGKYLIFASVSITNNMPSLETGAIFSLSSLTGGEHVVNETRLYSASNAFLWDRESLTIFHAVEVTDPSETFTTNLAILDDGVTSNITASPAVMFIFRLGD